MTSRVGLALAFVLALAVRLGAAWAWPSAPAKDALEYHRLAASLASGYGYVGDDGAATAFRPPGWPLLLSGVYRWTGADPAAGRCLLALIGALVAPIAGVLAGTMGGERAALAGAFGAALYPPFVTSWFSPRALLAEVALTTWSAAALALALLARSARVERPAARLAFGAGLAAGVAILTKGTVLFLPGLLALALLPRAGSKRRVVPAALVLLGAALVVAPWTLRNYRALGELVPVSTNGGISLWASYNPSSRGLGNAAEGYAEAVREDDALRRAGMSEPGRSRHFAALARAEIRERPGRALRLVGRKVLLFFDPTLRDWSRSAPPLAYNWAYGAMLPLALAGLVIPLAGAPERAARRLLVGFVGLLTLLHVLVHVDVRYRVALEPELIALAALAAVRAGAVLGGLRSAILGAAWLALHGVIAWRYESVFALLSRLTRALGLALS